MIVCQESQGMIAAVSGRDRPDLNVGTVKYVQISHLLMYNRINIYH